MGCIYMDQRKRAAGRGYAYVAVSRFQSRAGCHWYGKLRRSDFLPVGEEKEDEVLERGVESESTGESDGFPEAACQGGRTSLRPWGVWTSPREAAESVIVVTSTKTSLRTTTSPTHVFP